MSVNDHLAFICYTKQDQKIAKDLSKFLESIGVSTWLDVERLLVGENFENK